MLSRVLSFSVVSIFVITIFVGSISYFFAVNRINNAVDVVEVSVGKIEATIDSVLLGVSETAASHASLLAKLEDAGTEPFGTFSFSNDVFLRLHTDQFNFNAANVNNATDVAVTTATNMITYAVMSSIAFFTAYDTLAVDDAVKNAHESVARFWDTIEVVNKIDTSIGTIDMVDPTAVVAAANAADAAVAVATATRAIFWKVNQYSFIVSLALIIAIIFSIFLAIWVYSIVQRSIQSAYEEKSINNTLAYKIKISILSRKIEEEKDLDTKAHLKGQLQDLRQEYEALMSENLRRNDGIFVKDWREVLLVARKRLVNEEQRLLARNRANLTIGIIMAFFGVAVPVSYILVGGKVGASDGIWLFIINYLPALSAILIIEIVAIFFLSLYCSNERRLERNKSDLTNIELRLTSGLMLYEKANKDNFAILALIIFLKKPLQFCYWVKTNLLAGLTQANY